MNQPFWFGAKPYVFESCFAFFEDRKTFARGTPGCRTSSHILKHCTKYSLTLTHMSVRPQRSHATAAATASRAASPVDSTPVDWRWCCCLDHQPFHTESCLFLLSQINECLASELSRDPQREVTYDQLVEESDSIIPEEESCSTCSQQEQQEDLQLSQLD